MTPEDDPLEALMARPAHSDANGCPRPVERPHRVLLATIAGHRLTVVALTRLLVRDGVLIGGHGAGYGIPAESNMSLL